MRFGSGVLIFCFFLPLGVERVGRYSYVEVDFWQFGGCIVAIGHDDIAAIGLNFDCGYAHGEHAEFQCGAIGEVDDAAADEGASVVDAHYDLPSVRLVGDQEFCAEGVAAVGAGE